MPKLLAFIIGALYPLPYAENLRLLIDVEDGQLRLLLQFGIAGPTRAEMSALSTGDLRFSIVPAGPLCYFVLTANGLAYDAPYVLFLEDPATVSAILSAFAAWSDPDETSRQRMALDVIDTRTDILAWACVVLVSGTWIMELARSVSAQWPISDIERTAAIARDRRRWPRVAQMLVAASASEIAVRV